MNASDERINHYAQALYAIATAGGAVAAVTADLGHLLDFLRETPSFRQALTGAASHGERQALYALLDGRIHPLLIDFLRILQTNGDTGLLAGIAREWTTERGESPVMDGDIQSAAPLGEDHVRTIEDLLAERLGHPVRLRPRVIPNLLGGIRVKVGDWVLDGSLDGRLDYIRKRLSAAIAE